MQINATNPWLMQPSQPELTGTEACLICGWFYTLREELVGWGFFPTLSYFRSIRMSWNESAKAFKQAGFGGAQQSSSSPAAGGWSEQIHCCSSARLRHQRSLRDISSFSKVKFKAGGGIWRSSGNGNIPAWLPLPPAHLHAWKDGFVTEFHELIIQR